MRNGKPICYFDLEMRPNRSLDPRHFWWMLAGVALLFGLMGLRFLLLGAWPILPFLVADTGLLWWAMRASYRSGAALERLRLDTLGLQLIRRTPTGRMSMIRLDPDGTRVELEELALDQNRLWLRSGRDRLAVGGFLSPPERAELAAVITDGLRRRRGR